jgi:Tfp pilus assembly protein PilZ
MGDESSSTVYGFGDEVIIALLLIGAALYAASALFSNWMTPNRTDNRSASGEEVAGTKRTIVKKH